ncbi:hypothetical protein KLP40_14410 [Hymenobacter sp. NST-14]|uniref:hypothetical protein n=1 Tax=Hymenobacter piscis TaxID=2839984 RepID=UPI001C0387F7|nr:hypothetical protein [Hymenobacter piscis]MBT9394360.1 hypothetical protein [Hymenobacter piscis]
MTTAVLNFSRAALLIGIAFLLCALIDGIWFQGLHTSARLAGSSALSPSLALSMATLCIFVFWVQQLRRDIAGRPVAWALQIHCFSLAIITTTVAQWWVFLHRPANLAAAVALIPVTTFIVSLIALTAAYVLNRATRA